VALRAELSRAFAAFSFLGSPVWSPYLFAAGRLGWLMRPMTTKTAESRAGAFGVGWCVQFDL
jgi:hypothetical protein